MIIHDIEKMNYGFVMLEINGYICSIYNKFAAQRLDLGTGDILNIKWLGRMEIIGVIRRPYLNISDEYVQEVKFLCKWAGEYDERNS